MSALGDRGRGWLARETGLPNSTIGDAIQRGPAKVEVAIKLAQALGVSLDWLLTGAGEGTTTAPAAGTLRLADDASWIDVPEYDLREMTDESLGRAVVTAPIRRDWLNINFRASSDLWMTRLLSDYPPAALAEGTLVLCRTVRPEQLTEGHVCLWRVAERVVAGRFSVVPDDIVLRGAVATPDAKYGSGALAPFLDPALGLSSGDVVVAPSAIAAGRYHLIGRILGVMIRPI